MRKPYKNLLTWSVVKSSEVRHFGAIFVIMIRQQGFCLSGEISIMNNGACSICSKQRRFLDHVLWEEKRQTCTISTSNQGIKF